MTQENKQLLLKDLCARLPYGVKYCRDSWNYELDQEMSVVEVLEDIDKEGYINYYKVYKVDDIKPYLRPMSSMTEEEIKEYRNLSDEIIGRYGPYNHEFIAHCVRLGIKPDNPHECVDDFLNMEAIDWLNAHHFDYRIDPSTGKTLIESNLALEAPEGMYYG